jgi:hypothetical protein
MIRAAVLVVLKIVRRDQLFTTVSASTDRIRNGLINKEVKPLVVSALPICTLDCARSLRRARKVE